MRADTNRWVTLLCLGLTLTACENSGSGSSSTGGGTSSSSSSGSSSSGSSSSGSSSSGGTTGGTWQCDIASEGTCTCTNAPTSPGLADCSQASATCCASCDDLGDQYQFCACENIDSSQGKCIAGNTICGSQTLSYKNAQLVNSCPPQP